MSTSNQVLDELIDDQCHFSCFFDPWSPFSTGTGGSPHSSASTGSVFSGESFNVPESQFPEMDGEAKLGPRVPGKLFAIVSFDLHSQLSGHRCCHSPCPELRDPFLTVGPRAACVHSRKSTSRAPDSSPEQRWSSGDDCFVYL